jgi:hypothetical protein
MLRAESELLMSEIYTTQVSITTVGSAGAAEGTGYLTGIHGFLLDVYLNYHASCPATADVEITHPTFGEILTNSNSKTDVWLMPRKQTCDPAAADTGMYELIPVNDTLTVRISGADSLTACLVATVRWITP